MIFFHVIHHFSLVFDGELIANDFKYHRDILDTMVDVDIKDKEEFIKELMKLFIIVFYVILHSFLPRNQLIIILCTHGHVGHHDGSRGQVGVHQVVYYFCHIIHHFGLVFDGKLIEMISSTQGYVGHQGGRRHQGQ